MVYIIVVNYKSWADTRDCLYSLLDSSFGEWKVIVVDNGSNDSSLFKIKRSLCNDSAITPVNIPICTHASELNNCESQIILLQNDENLGFAGANNLVLEQLLHKNGYVWMLNPDMIVEKDTLANLYRCASQERIEKTVWGITIKSFINKQNIEIIGGGKVNALSGTVTMIKDYNAIHELDYINGSSLFTSISTFREAGLFNEDYFLYWEETDWCFSARDKNISFKVCENTFAYDKGATSIGRGFLSDYYYGRNSLFFLKRHFSNLYILSALSISVIRVIYRYLTGRRDRAKGLLFGVIDYLNGKQGKR